MIAMELTEQTLNDLDKLETVTNQTSKKMVEEAVRQYKKDVATQMLEKQAQQAQMQQRQVETESGEQQNE